MIYRLTTSHSRKIRLAQDILNAIAFVGLGIGIMFVIVVVLLYWHVIRI